MNPFYSDHNETEDDSDKEVNEDTESVSEQKDKKKKKTRWDKILICWCVAQKRTNPQSQKWVIHHRVLS